MKTYPTSHWEALGRWVASARLQAGYSDTRGWAAAVGRSTRMLLGLERGEPVGAKTIEAVSEVLGVPNWSLFSILDSGEEAVTSWTDAKVEQARLTYEAETGLEADDGPGEASLLDHFADDELLAELSRRLATRPLSRTERRMKQAHAAADGDRLSVAPDNIPVAADDTVGREEEAEADPHP